MSRLGVPFRPDFTARRPTAGQNYIVQAAAAQILHRAQSKLVTEVIEERWGRHNNNLEIVTRAATTPSTSATYDAASLVGIGVQDFVGLLSGASASAAMIAAGMQLEFPPGTGQLLVQAVTASATAVDFIEEGKPIKVPQIDLSPSLRLSPKKLASVMIFSREIAEHSTPSIEQLTRAALGEAIGLSLDTKMLDATAADATRPAGLRNGISTSSASGSTNETAMAADIATLVTAVAAVAGNAPVVFVAHPVQATKLRLWNRSNFQYPIYATSALSAGIVVCIASNALVTAIDPMPTFQLVDTAVVHEEDTTPLDITTAAVSATVKSLWQSDLVGLRVTSRIAWGLRAAGGLAWLTATGW
jgi:hypothetical protein